LARRGARLVIVVGGTQRIPRVGNVAGLIALETMGAAVIENARAYAPSAARDPFPSLYRKRVIWPPFPFRRGRRGV